VRRRDGRRALDRPRASHRDHVEAGGGGRSGARAPYRGHEGVEVERGGEHECGHETDGGHSTGARAPSTDHERVETVGRCTKKEGGEKRTDEDSTTKARQ